MITLTAAGRQPFTPSACNRKSGPLRPVGVRALVLLLAALCAACATVTAGPPAPPAVGDVPGYGPDPAALATWADFPAGARPRLLVLHPPPAGADWTARPGRFVLATPVPSPPATLPVSLPEGTFAMPTTTAEAALAAMSGTGSTFPVSAVLGTAVFGTDRANRVLPAWLVTVPWTADPLAWPALAPSTYRVASGGIIQGAKVSADGRSLTVAMPAGPGDGCPGTPRVRAVPVALESPGSVAVGLRTVVDGTMPGTPDPGCGVCPGCATSASLQLAVYAVPLAAPLGGRVVLGPIGPGSAVVLNVEPA